jgi:TM2 domain-containing membrane protein YozV
LQSDVQPSHEQSPDADPLVGTRERTDSAVEAARDPADEMVLDTPPHGRPHRSRAVAGALGLLLGGLGAHRFYLGYVRVGLVQLSVTVGAFVIAAVTALILKQNWFDVLIVGGGVAMLGVLWGIFEGVAIFAGLLESDADGRPLRHGTPAASPA